MPRRELPRFCEDAPDGPGHALVAGPIPADGLRSAIWAALVLAFAAVCCGMSDARELWASEDGAGSFSLQTALKGTSLISQSPDDGDPKTEEDSMSSLWRLRLTLDAHLNESMRLQLAYEQRTRVVSENAASSGGGLLPSTAQAPFRVEQLDWNINEVGETYSHRHEIDRAIAAFDFDVADRAGQLAVGRQAIGMGRGVFFGAIDLFSPFSPAEVDREWRRGVDALRLVLPLTDAMSFDLISAFGEDWSESALVGRVQGANMETGTDLGVVFGKRGEDLLLGVSTSFLIGEAEMHVDLAAFHITDESAEGELWGMDDYTSKAVVGFSHRLFEGNGPTIMAEYHYSGFGVESIEDAALRFADPDDPLSDRLFRGDMQIIGQHALALQSSWELGDAWSASITVIGSPVDGSGLVQPTLSWNFADNVTIVFSGAAAFGEPAEGPIPQSEYGGSPSALFMQLRIYD